MRIAIIGGGIGGLTLALALRARGIRADVYEQAAALTEIGAAVALSANANREYARLGLLAAIEAAGVEPTELIWRDGLTGARIAAHPVRTGGAYRARFGAPYLGIHRADLQRILSDALGAEALHLGHRLAAIDEAGDGVRLRFTNGHALQADLVVGADGVRSAVRGWIANEAAAPRYSGTSAFRGIVPAALLPALPDPQAIQFWMGADAHLLHYAIGAAGDVNFFAVVEGPRTWPGAGWTIETAPGEAVAAFAGWHPAVTEMIAASTFTARWGLFVGAPLAAWQRKAAVLIGDAAHAMLPHHGQGANTTIEDAVTLAALIPGMNPANRAARLHRYERLRRLRARLIQRCSRDTNRALHLQDAAARLARDATLPGFPARYGWIHGFDARAQAEAAAEETDGARPLCRRLSAA